MLASLKGHKRHVAVPLLEQMVARGELGVKSGKGFYDHGPKAVETAYETILVRKDPATGVATLTLNRPDRLNTINPEMVEELDRALADLENDASVRCLVITGAGEKAFSAGADVTAFGSIDKSYKSWGYSRRTSMVINRLADFPKITLAAINGYAFGGGLEIAIACDFRVAAKKAKMGQTELRLGLITGAGGIPRLVKLLGLARAKEIVLLGTRMTAEEADKIGLITHVFENEDFAKGVAEFAHELANAAPVAVRLAKLVLNRSADLPTLSGLELEALAFGHVTSTEDVFEGIQAMMEKRDPKFKGE